MVAALTRTPFPEDPSIHTATTPTRPQTEQRGPLALIMKEELFEFEAAGAAKEARLLLDARVLPRSRTRNGLLELTIYGRALLPEFARGDIELWSPNSICAKLAEKPFHDVADGTRAVVPGRLGEHHERITKCPFILREADRPVLSRKNEAEVVDRYPTRSRNIELDEPPPLLEPLQRYPRPSARWRGLALR